MFRKTMFCAAAAAMMGICGASFAAVVTETTGLARDGDGIVNKKVIQHANGDRTVVKKKTKYNAYGQKVVKKKVVRHTASAAPASVTVVRPATRAVVVHRDAPVTSTTVIRRVD